ncbi:hypothetical protein [Methyloceanibacter sp.]|uniref:hypothetical protein n=1 Tax=Methyloceanibacter sp. TaxID=1965321 RepID=UPI003C720EE9
MEKEIMKRSSTIFLQAVIVVRGEDDIAGGVAMGIFVALISIAIAIAAAVFERKFKNPNELMSICVYRAAVS